MKLVLALALNDLRRALRSFFLLGMTLGAPAGICAIIALSFAATTPGDFDAVKMAVVSTPAHAALLEILEHDTLRSVVEVRRVRSLEDAKQQILNDEVEVALVLTRDKPPRLLHDPTDTLRPRIVEAVLDRILDVQAGAELTPPARRADYFEWVSSTQIGGPALTITSPRPDRTASALDRIKARVLLAQLVFFAFFAAGYGAQTLLRDEEEGTLSRLRTFPLSVSTLLGAKALFLAVLVALQAVVLLVLARWAFGVELGTLGSVALGVFGLIFGSVGLGLFLTSLVKTSRQVGPLLGSGLTVMGMAGGLFTVAFTELPGALALIALCFPQGWAFRGFELAMSGASLEASLTSTGVCAAMGALFGSVGLFRYHRRFTPRPGGGVS